ncbi:MAG: M15 family metallopeptidase [Clostridiales bacterium]|nr:M15 family metallopeptidase [Clostridiales bacterium]
MRKHTTLLTLLLALLLALTGCGGSAAEDAGATDGSADSSAVSSADPGPEEGVTSISSQPVEEEGPALTAADVYAMDAGTILTAEELDGLDTSELFFYEDISDQVFARMEGVSFGADCTTAREDLRYVRVLHTGFDGETHIGELVVNQAIAEDVVEIFQGLYGASYPIEKMLLIDEYGGDDELSMEDNNTSCFNFRAVSGTEHLSQHAYGLAIDVNPLYNPYITSSGYEPYNAGDYIDRTLDFDYKIDETDLCYQLFTQHGFTWGGSWSSVKDYQHFQLEAE